MCLSSSKTTGKHPCDTPAGCPTLNNWAAVAPPAPHPLEWGESARGRECRRENTSGDESGNWRTGTGTRSVSTERQIKQTLNGVVGPSTYHLWDLSFLLPGLKGSTPFCSLSSLAESGPDCSFWIFVIQAIGSWLRQSASLEPFSSQRLLFA